MTTGNSSHHTMNTTDLESYCKSKIHDLFLEHPHVKEIEIIPEYRRNKTISKTEKVDKLFNYKRPTAEIHGKKGLLYVFPGADYVEHYKNIYKQQNYTVLTHDFSDKDTRKAINAVFPDNFPDVDIVVLGYVEPLVGNDHWHSNDHIAWKSQEIGGKKVGFVGVTFSYWGDIIYYIVEKLAQKTTQLIYVGKLGSLQENDVPNQTIASGDSSVVKGDEMHWENIFADSPFVSLGKHISLPSVLDETSEWFHKHKDEYRYVDPEIGWAAKACLDNSIHFSYIHLVTDNLHDNFTENLTNERDKNVIEKRLQYIGIIKSIIWHAITRQNTSLYTAVLQAQQARVDRGLLKPLQRDWQACLSFAYHTQEEAWEIVRELPRREWKDQEVVPQKLLSEVADTQIQLLTTLAYAGFTEEDLRDAVLDKLQAKRKDWK